MTNALAIPDASISIPSDKLCQLLKQATYMHSERHMEKDILQPQVRKRRRETTPEEELASDDEAWFQLQEEQAEETAFQDDGPYKESSQ